MNEGDGRQTGETYFYQEPFGTFTESQGTDKFPRFDLKSPSFIWQSTAYDCGLAVAANSMAFVKGLKDVKFMKSKTERHYSSDVCFLLNDQISLYNHAGRILSRRPAIHSTMAK
jgi:hypothetical protein